jgi:Macrocin-O-methyltransferase (TylF)
VNATELYLDLLKRTLTGLVYDDPPIPVPWSGLADGVYQPHLRTEGIDWPRHAPCMIGLERLENVRQCVELVLADNVPGDLAEAGVWRGGTVIYMRALLRLHDVTDRDVWVIDSFAGLPPHDGQADSGSFMEPEMAALAVPLAEVRHNFELYGLLDDQVKFLEGWFCDTLPGALIGPLSVLRLDGDLYQSQLDVLTHLYPRLSPGGFVIVDDPNMPGCARAVREYREENSITDPVLDISGLTAYWRKS